MAAETTLILLKPDCVEKQLCGEVIRRFESDGFHVRGIKMLSMTDSLLQEHYSHIADRPFFPEVVAFMKKSPVIAIALHGDNVVERVRDRLGPTDSSVAEKGTIRGDFGLNSMENIAHASDSAENAKIELDRFFTKSEIFDF